MLQFLYEGIRKLIELMYGWCGDYGVAIVLITVVIRLCLLPLNYRQRQAIKKPTGKDVPVGPTGCLLTFLQFFLMLVLYRGMRLAVAVNMTTILLPWVPSLLARDGWYILPFITVLLQMIPQLLPYLRFFRNLSLQRMSPLMLLVMLAANSWFAAMLPAGIGLFYLVSGAFSTLEQATIYFKMRKLIPSTDRTA